MTKIIDGKKHAQDMRAELKLKFDEFAKNKGRRASLAVIIVGNDPASQVYVRNKVKGCEEVGIKSSVFSLPSESSQSDVEQLVSSVCEDVTIDAVLVQLPLPKHIDEKKILSLIPVEKDVDGFCAQNVGSLCLNEKCTVSCTPNGVMELLKREGIAIEGKNALVLGRSAIVGKPMAMLLLNANATVTVCHSKTRNLNDICLGADIIVAAVGIAKFLKADMVKDGAVVIDVGINRNESGKLCGDVDFENVAPKCSYITPVPGGVGPMTITMLLYNTLQLATRR